MTFLDSPGVTRRSARVLFINSTLVGSLFAYSAAYAQAPQTQIEEDRARLGNSTPLVEQIDPATIRDSERAQADAAEKAAGDDKLDTSGNLLGPVRS